MYSTAHKRSSLRVARAEARFRAPRSVLEVLQARTGPKGDALEMARAAGTLAAKRTWELIPLCHPLPLDHVAIEYTFHDDHLQIAAEVTTVWKTGVEMEALVAVQITAATIYDMMKPLDTELVIDGVQVTAKRGGKSSWRETIPHDCWAAVLVTSDGTAAGQRQDKSGRLIKEYIEGLGISRVEYLIVPDDRATIERQLLTWCESRCPLILTTGGTGLGPRDVTVEATQAVIEREIPGIMEAARAYGQARTPYAMLSRGLAGQRGGTILVNLPGSSRGTQETLDAIFPALLHAYPMIQGGGH